MGTEGHRRCRSYSVEISMGCYRTDSHLCCSGLPCVLSARHRYLELYTAFLKSKVKRSAFALRFSLSKSSISTLVLQLYKIEFAEQIHKFRDTQEKKNAPARRGFSSKFDRKAARKTLVFRQTQKPAQLLYAVRAFAIYFSVESSITKHARPFALA